MYIAIIGDIVDSRQIEPEQRKKIQIHLRRVLAQINERFQASIVSQFTITLGDEFQGLLENAERLFEMLDGIDLGMAEYGITIRFGVGLGEIVTDINQELSIGADGSAYWNARTAIDRIHDHSDYGVNHVAFHYPEEQDSPLINDAIALTEYMKKKWTPTQRDVLKTLIQGGIYEEGFNQQDLADTMGISRNSLHKRVSTSGIRIYLRSRKEIERKIGRLHDGA